MKTFVMGEKQTQAAPPPPPPEKKPRVRVFPGKLAIIVLCSASFLIGFLFGGPLSAPLSAPLPSSASLPIPDAPKLMLAATGRRSAPSNVLAVLEHNRDVIGEVSKTHQAIQSLEKTISSLEMELSIERMTKMGVGGGAAPSSSSGGGKVPKKAFMVVGINTGFENKRRREAVRETWLAGDRVRRMERMGVVVRFVIGRSAVSTGGGGAKGALDRAIDAEEAETKDFLRLEKHVEGYHELSAKTRLYFATAASLWDADFYVKVDDDVHLNLGTLAATLGKYRTRPRIYVGCMKSGPVLSQRGVRYHEPEFMKFGDEGNMYFRHATGQIYAISKDLATYISINLPILHKYANEDVSLGSWLIGLDVEHVDERSLCCGTPPDCERRRREGDVCAAAFDWSCSGVCNAVERMKGVHAACGEGDDAAAAWDWRPPSAATSLL